MYTYETIEEIHLEVTSRCNASCPQCPRTEAGGQTNPHLPLGELDLFKVKQIFPQEFIANLSKMYMCGNYGDAIVARDTMGIFQYFRDCNSNINLKLYTNGGVQPPQWWKRLAGIINVCRFAIDGLEDTNAIYRRGTKWRRIMENADAFIKAGGIAEWSFIVFKHNEHQIEEARSLSNKMGFATFQVIKTSRFGENGLKRASTVIKDRSGTAVSKLEIPTDQRYQNEQLVQIDRMIRGGENYESYLDHIPIRCRALLPNSIYISAEGLVFPCCWTANIYHSKSAVGSAPIWTLINQLPGGKYSLSALKHSLREIIQGPFFQKLIPESWEQTVGGGRLKACARKCGVSNFS